MPEKFSEIFVGKSYEEIRNIIKNHSIATYKYGLERASHYIDYCKKRGENISREASDNYTLNLKSLENIDEAVDASMRESALDLYREVSILNHYYGDRSIDSKKKVQFHNIMNYRILPIINGFGVQSKYFYEKIADTAFIDPSEVFHKYIRMKGIDAITPTEYLEQASSLLYRHDLSENEIKELAELDIRRGDNVRFGLLTRTKEELIKELSEQYGAKSMHM